MNTFNLYRQVLQGKWFIHYSYAITMGALLDNIFKEKASSDVRDWMQAPTMDLEQSKGRASLPMRAANEQCEINSIQDLDQVAPGSVAIIPLKGVMVKYGTWCEYGTEEIAAALIRAAEHSNIEAIILDIDSGGGAVDAVPPMIEAIDRVRNEFNKPILACADLCASAAYWVASRCDRVLALNPISSEFGSIGVMMSFWDMVPFYEKEGYKFHRIYAPESTHKNLPLENALQGKYDLIKEEELSPLAIAFQDAIRDNRGSKLKMETEGLLNGRMFYAVNKRESGLNAQGVGLIDGVSTLSDAISLALSMSEVKRFMND